MLSAGSFVLSYQQHGQCIQSHCVVLFLFFVHRLLAATFAGRHRSILHTIKPRGPPTRVGSAAWHLAIPSKTFSRRRSSKVNTRASFFVLPALTSLCAFGVACASGCILPSACSWLRQCALKCAGTFGHQAVRRHAVVWRVISSVQLVSWRCGLFHVVAWCLAQQFP